MIFPKGNSSHHLERMGEFLQSVVKIFGKKSDLLFQDMFPVLPSYIDGPYIKGGQLVRITDPKLIQSLEKNAIKILNLLHHGVRFTPTQPDINRIENILLTELKA